MISIMRDVHTFTAEILDELHLLVEHLWADISKNKGKQVQRLLDQHEQSLQMRMNGPLIKRIQMIEAKINEINKIQAN